MAEFLEHAEEDRFEILGPLDFEEAAACERRTDEEVVEPDTSTRTIRGSAALSCARAKDAEKKRMTTTSRIRMSLRIPLSRAEPLALSPSPTL